MFKWSKLRNSDIPSTPKLPSVLLPGDIGVKKVSAAQRYTDLSQKSTRASTLGTVVPDRRSMTPHPGSSRSRRDSEGGHSSRIRTMSMTSGFADAAVKPSKRIYGEDLAKPGVSVPSHINKGGSCDHDEKDTCAGSLKSAMKGGGHSHHATNGRYLENTLSQAEHPGRHESALSSHHEVTNGYHRTRNESFTRHTASVQTPKYMKAYIKEVPQKEEALALSWPLIDYASRRRSHSPKPALYFDIGFDPRVDKYNVRANRGGYSTPLSPEECNIPATPYRVLTKMVITCRALLPWPVVVRRQDGIRCIDIFREIYDTYHVVLTKDDMEGVGEEYIERCRRAFAQRCEDSPGLGLYNQRRGMRRVDLLRGRRIFKGLTQDTGGNWTLHFDDPPR